MIRKRRALSIVLLSILSLVPAGVRADYVDNGLVISRPANYDYAPTVIVSGTGGQMWWCGSGQGPTGVTDTIWYRAWNASGWTGPATQVMAPTANAWDKIFTCDPSVVKGTFVNPANGLTYTYVMYYTGTDKLDPMTGGTGWDGRVGLAYSNDGVTWVKYPSPVVYPVVYPTPTSSPTCPPAPNPASYGAGQPAAYRSNSGAGVRLFYTDTTATPIGMYYRSSTNGVTFGPPTKLSSNGAPLVADSDFALDTASGQVYALIGVGIAPPSLPTPPGPCASARTYHGVYRMPESQFLAGTGTWEELGMIDTNRTGRADNFAPGMARDPSGYVTPFMPNVISYFASGDGGPANWDIYSVTWRPTPATVGLRQAWDANVTDHWETTGYIAPSYTVTRTMGYLHMAPQAGSQALWNCQAWVGYSTIDNFVTTDSNCEGWYVLGKSGYIYTTPPPGVSTVAIYRCYSAPFGDNYLSDLSNCGGGQFIGLLGYAKTTA